MVGNKYRLFGTDTVFEITADAGTHWEITVSSSAGKIDGVSIGKQSLNDSVQAGTLKKV